MRHGIVEGEPNVIPSPLKALQWLTRKRQPEVDDRRWSRLAAYALCRDDAGRILLARCAPWLPVDAGCWTMPGGKVEWGEHPDVAVVRELAEETGLVGTVRGVIAVWSHVLTADVAVSGEPGHLVGIVYDVEVVGGELRHETGGTTDQAAWFSLDEAGALDRVPIVDFCLVFLEASSA